MMMMVVNKTLLLLLLCSTASTGTGTSTAHTKTNKKNSAISWWSQQQQQQQNQRQNKEKQKQYGHLRRSNQQQRETATKIIGGTVAKEPYPYFGLWEVGCGASLIHNDMVLTAAHCDVDDIFARRIYFGGLDTDSGVTRNVVKVIKHPQYSEYTNSFDFLVLKLNATALEDYVLLQDNTNANSANATAATSVNKKKTAEAPSTYKTVPTGLAPVSLNRNVSNPQPNDSLTIMGFGITDPNAFGLEESLHETQVLAVSDEDCARAYRGSPFDADVMLCAGDPRGGHDSCQGDSGGPMVDANNAQVGIVSWGEGCGERDHPGVYSKVVAVIDWIDEQICTHSCFPPEYCPVESRHACASAPSEVAAEGAAAAAVAANLRGPVSFTITVTMDAYPSEFAAILEHVDSGSELWYVGYDSYEDEESLLTDLIVLEQTFSNLPAGVYRLILGDKSRDGICCGYGNGGVNVTSNNAEQSLIWFSDGRYGGGEEVYMNISETGEAVWVANNADGTIDDGWGEADADDGSWWADDGSQWDDDAWVSGGNGSNFDPKEDPDWPGEFPTEPSKTIMFNIKTDRFPEETSWTWEKRTGPDEWEILDEGNPQAPMQVFSHTQSLESETVYRLSVLDSLSDGTCCMFGQGWLTITNATIPEVDETTTDTNNVNGTNSTALNGTVMWSAVGDDFGDQLDVYLWADPQGLVYIVEYLPGEGYALIQYEFISGERTIVARDTSIDRHDAMDP